MTEREKTGAVQGYQKEYQAELGGDDNRIMRYHFSSHTDTSIMFISCFLDLLFFIFLQGFMGYFKYFSERDYLFFVKHIYNANYLNIYESTLGITFNNKLLSCEMNI